MDKQGNFGLIKRCIGFLGLYLLAGVCLAELPCELRLDQIQAEALSEDNGDEVYLSITAYSNQAHPKEYRVPSFPKYWKFNTLSAVKNLSIWKGVLQKDEKIRLLISVVEQDTPPWDVDDLIGTLELDLQAVDGQILSQWSVPNWDGQPRIESLPMASPTQASYRMHGENSRYQLQLTLEKGR